MKSPLLIIGVLIVIALFTALIGPLFVDWSQYRAEIEEYGRELTGREVSVNGDIDITLLPLPNLTLGNVSIANSPGSQAEAFISAKHLSARLSLTPLLRGKLQVTSFVLEEPVIELERLDNGSGNWWLKPTIDLSDVVKIDEIALEALRLNDATIVMRDARRGGVARFENGNLTISAGSLSGPIQVRGELSYGNEPIAIAVNSGKRRPDGSLRLNVRLKPQTGMRLIYNFDGQLTGKNTGELSHGRFRIVPAPVEDAGKGDQLAVIERLPFEFSSEVKIFEEKVNFNKVSFALDKRNPITNAFVGRGSIALSYDVAVEGQFEARRLDMNVLKEQLGAELAGRLRNVLSLETIDATVKNMPHGVSASFSVNADQVASEGDVIEDAQLALSASSERIKVSSLKGILPGRTKFALNGLYLPNANAPQFNGEIALDALDGRSLLNWFRPNTYAEGEGNIGRLTMGGNLTVTPAQVRISDGSFSFDGGMGSGSLEWGRFDNQPIEVVIKSEKLDLKTLAPDKAGFAGMPQLLRNLAGKDAEVVLKIDAGQIALDDTTLSPVAGDLVLSPRAVLIRELSAGIGNGDKLNVSGELNGFPDKVRGMLTGAISARDGQILTGLLKGFSIPAEVASLIAGHSLDIVAEIDAGDQNSRIVLTGRAAGGTLDANLSTEGHLGEWLRSSMAITSVYTSADASNILRMFGVVPHTSSGDGSIRLEANGSLADGMQVAITGEGSGASYHTSGAFKVSDGKISGAGELGLVAEDGANLASVLGFHLAKGVPLSIKSKLFARSDFKKYADIEAEYVVGEGTGNFSGKIEGGKERYTISGNLISSELDLTVLAGNLLLGENSSISSAGWSDRVFRQDALKAFDGNVSVKVKKLRLSEKMELSDASFITSIDTGAVEITALTGQFQQGRFDGGFALKPGPVSERIFSANIGLKNVDVKNWLSSAEARPLAEGRLSLNGSLEARGRSLAGLVSVLSGAGDWTVHNARVEGIDPENFEASLAEAGKSITVDELIEQKLRSGALEFGPVKGNWTISSGLMRFDPLPFNTGSTSTNLSVFADLPGQKIDASLSIKLTNDPKLPDFGLALVGPIDDLKRIYDTSALKSFLVVRALKEGVDRLEELQAEQQRIYEEQKKLEEEEIARREAEQERKEAEEQARLEAEQRAQEEAEKIKAEKDARREEERAKLREEEEARRQLEAELRRQEQERLRQIEIERQRALDAAVNSNAITEQPLPFDNSPAVTTPTIIVPPTQSIDSETFKSKRINPAENR